jgi:segregation and condensation protein B
MADLISFPGGRKAPAPEPVPEPTPGELEPPRSDFLLGALEAVLFAAPQPLTLNQLHAALGKPEMPQLNGAITTLRNAYLRRGAGIRLVEVAKGYQLRSVPRAAPYIAHMRGEQPFRLSKAAVETLAIVAYRQPVTKAEVDDIRGVDCGGVLRSLLEKQLLKHMGRKEELPGRPIIFGTSDRFLEVFGLKDLSDLPTLRDLRELQGSDPDESAVQLDLPELF